MLYMKMLREEAGSWEIIKLDPEQYTAEGLLHDLYQSKGWADASEEEYVSQVGYDVEAPAEEVAAEEVAQ